MANDHSGNILNEITREEHDGSINAKRVHVVSGSLSGGQATVTILGNVTISDSKGFIGLVTSVPSTTNRSIVGNVTLSDSKTYIGLVTATIGNSPNVSVIGNVTLSDSKTFIGLVTAVPSTTNRSLIGNVTLSDAKTYIGLVTATIGNSPNVSILGNVTTYPAQYSFYQQASLVSGYTFYGFALPGSNPTTANFKIQRETLNTGEVLYASGLANFVNIWSAASLASITYL